MHSGERRPRTEDLGLGPPAFGKACWPASLQGRCPALQAGGPALPWEGSQGPSLWRLALGQQVDMGCGQEPRRTLEREGMNTRLWDPQGWGWGHQGYF